LYLMADFIMPIIIIITTKTRIWPIGSMEIVGFIKELIPEKLQARLKPDHLICLLKQVTMFTQAQRLVRFTSQKPRHNGRVLS